MNSNSVKKIKEEWDAAVKKSIIVADSDIKSVKKRFSGEGLSHYYVKIIDELKPKKDSVWLDVCCGSGSNSFALATNHTCNVISFDISLERLMIGKKLMKNYSNTKNIVFINADLFHLPFNEKIFDGIIATQSFSPYVVDEQKVAIKNLFCFLKRNGLFIISDYNKGAKIYHMIGSSGYYEILKEMGYSVLEVKQWGHIMFSVLSRFRYKILRKIVLKASNKKFNKFYSSFTKFVFKVGDFENKFSKKEGVLFHIVAKK